MSNQPQGQVIDQSRELANNRLRRSYARLVAAEEELRIAEREHVDAAEEVDRVEGKL